MRVIVRNLLWMSLLVTVSACSSVDKYNPFSADKPAETYKPANSTEYQCQGNARFFVRMLNKENAAWLIYPNREVRLPATAEGSNRYSNGVAVLEINGTEATLTDGPNINYTECKAIATTK